MDLIKYNQRLLAIMGTLALIGLVLIVFLGGLAWAIDLFVGRTYYQENTLAIDNAEETTNKESFPTRAITFEEPKLIDTLNSIYLIPVSQVVLDPELSDYYTGGTARSGDYYSKQYRYQGNYNNLLLYHQQNEKKTAVFDAKTHISDFEYLSMGNRGYILMSATQEDTNEDRKLDANDLKSFYCYSIDEDRLFQFKIEGLGLDDYHPTYKHHEIVLSYVKDLNGNGEIDRSSEPVVLKCPWTCNVVRFPTW